MPPPRSVKRQLAELATTEWEDEPQPAPSNKQNTLKERPVNRTKGITEQEDETRQESPRPKRQRLDRKDGRELVKDTPVVTNTATGAETTAAVVDSTATEQTTTLEIIREPRALSRPSRSKGKGVLMAESEVLKYPDIVDTVHEFGALLQFGTTYELMEFLATQQIKVSQQMAEEHVEQ